MKPSSYDRIVDVMEELVRFAVLMRPHIEQLVERYSERKQAGVRLDAGTDLAARQQRPRHAGRARAEELIERGESRTSL